MGSGWAWLYFWGEGGVWEIGDFRENAQKWSFFRARCRSMGAFFVKKLPIYILFKYTPPTPPPAPPPPPHPHIPVTNPPTPECKINIPTHPNNISRILFIIYLIYSFYKLNLLLPARSSLHSRLSSPYYS